MDTTIYNFKELCKIVEEQKYKFISLLNLQGEKIVPFNSIKGGTVKSKLKEIELRMKRLPAGVYILDCKSVYGTNTNADKYYLGVGKYNPAVLSEAPPVTTPQTPVTTKKESVNLLSMENAMKYIQENADLKARVSELEAKNKLLCEQIEQYEAEEEESEGMEEESSNGIGALFKDMLPVIEPLAQKFFDLEEKKLNFNQAKFLHEGGYEIPGVKKAKANGSARNVYTQPGNQQPEQKEIPQPGAEGWEEYIQSVIAMDEETFNTHLAQLEQHAPDIYEAVCKEVFYDEGGNQ